jgi:hypothetical protein
MRVAETGTPGSKRLDVPRRRPTGSCRVCESDWLRNSRLSEMLDQEIGQNPYMKRSIDELVDLCHPPLPEARNKPTVSTNL